MEKTAFEARVISVFYSLKYEFYTELQNGETLKRMPASQYAAFLALGAIGGLSMFAINQPSYADKEVITELERLGALCDLIGIKFSAGGVQLVLFVQGDNYADETVIGKCLLIRDQLNSFKKFTMRIGWTKMPVFASVFLFLKSRIRHSISGSLFKKSASTMLCSVRFMCCLGASIFLRRVFGHTKAYRFLFSKRQNLKQNFFQHN